MKPMSLLIMFFLFSSFQMKAQNQDSLIQIYSGMGDTLDFIDREMFELYPDFEGFKYAQLFNRNNQYLISIINCLDNGIEKRIPLIENISKISEFNYKISRFEKENLEKNNKLLDVSITKNDQNILEGKLKMFSKKYLFLDYDNYSTNLEGQLLHYKIPITQINYLGLTEEKGFEKNLKYIGFGTLGGGALGFLTGLAIGPSENFDRLDNFQYGALCGLVGIGVGALVGLIIGEIAEPYYTDFTITFNSPNDILKLREYSAYYFKPDNKIEDLYKEIK